MVDEFFRNVGDVVRPVRGKIAVEGVKRGLVGENDLVCFLGRWWHVVGDGLPESEKEIKGRRGGKVPEPDMKVAGLRGM